MGQTEPICSSADSGLKDTLVVEDNAPVHNVRTTKSLRDQMGNISAQSPPPIFEPQSDRELFVTSQEQDMQAFQSP